jgi:hypothetical protein
MAVPIWAGMIALVNEKAAFSGHASAGLLNQTLSSALLILDMRIRPHPKRARRHGNNVTTEQCCERCERFPLYLTVALRL